MTGKQTNKNNNHIHSQNGYHPKRHPKHECSCLCEEAGIPKRSEREDSDVELHPPSFADWETQNYDEGLRILEDQWSQNIRVQWPRRELHQDADGEIRCLVGGIEQRNCPRRRNEAYSEFGQEGC